MTEFEIRRATIEDDPRVLDLLRPTMGWETDSPAEEFFWWKHRQNAFGVSPAWVALDGERIVGYRTLLRWRFVNSSGKVLHAVRAVDTATDPDYRGRGIFRTLTLEAVADLTRAGEAFIFNTPNDQSRPGYLSMGWTPVRRLPVGILPASPAAMTRMVRSRVPSNLWSEPTRVGEDAREALLDDGACDALLAHAPSRGLRTERTRAYLRWRTSFGPLAYRVLWVQDHDPGQGGVVFRVRRRGDSLELVVVELLVPSVRAAVPLLRRALAETGADYAIALRSGPAAGLLPLPGQGPLLVGRALARGLPPGREWTLTMADIELF